LAARAVLSADAGLLVSNLLDVLVAFYLQMTAVKCRDD